MDESGLCLVVESTGGAAGKAASCHFAVSAALAAKAFSLSTDGQVGIHQPEDG
jgi:hypothetical protein